MPIPSSKIVFAEPGLLTKGISKLMTMVEKSIIPHFGFLVMACKSTMPQLKKFSGGLFHHPALHQLITSLNGLYFFLEGYLMTIERKY